MDQIVDVGCLPRRRKTGGRQKGTPNRRTAERQAALEAIKASGRNPMAFFADLLGNEQAPLELRFQAAKEFAPFVHPEANEDEGLQRLATEDD